VDYGFVGDTDAGNFNSSLIHKLCEAGLTPVLAPLTHDGQGNLLNTNADTIACITSQAMSAFYDTKLMYCFEKKGVLKDSNDDNSVIEKIELASYEKLKEDKVISGGMIPKLENAFHALSGGVLEVLILDSKDIKDACSKKKVGTLLTL
jgi:acetylglutamate kinase